MGAVELTLVRHGESVGNIANAVALANRAEVIEVGLRDADVPLSPLGQEQAQALGAGMLQWERPPETLWCSPYLRAVETAHIAIGQARLSLPMRVDERLRDRELGVLDLLTSYGVDARFPAEAVRRQWLGKFYYRPPGGESWADVALRLRSLLRDIDADDDGKRVLVVAHDAVILLFRYVCEGLTESDLLSIAANTSVRNASTTRLVRPSGTGLWTAAAFNVADHLKSMDVPVTEHGGTSDGLPE